MKVGVVGLPNVGKSTLFNALTNAGAESANYPFCTIEPNVGIVSVKDERLDVLAKLYNCNKITPAVIEFVDIAGLVEGASKGEGLGNKFLSHIREVDAIAHVVRCFNNQKIISVNQDVNPVRDAKIINLELILSDLESITKRLDRVAKSVKTGAKEAIAERDLCEKIKNALENEIPARALSYNEEEAKILKDLFLITSKPVIYVANIAEEEIGQENDYVKALKQFGNEEGASVVVISAKIEEELAKLQEDERQMFMEELGIKETGLTKVIRTGYRLLNYITFFTAGPMESKAWTVEKGTPAPQAAGKIHTDLCRGFIRMETVSYADMVECGSWNKAKEAGKLRIEGKDYIVEDGDVIHVRFSV